MKVLLYELLARLRRTGIGYRNQLAVLYYICILFEARETSYR